MKDTLLLIRPISLLFLNLSITVTIKYVAKMTGILQSCIKSQEFKPFEIPFHFLMELKNILF